MNFRIYERGANVSFKRHTMYLRKDNWDDYNYKTSFYVFYCNDEGNVNPIGQLKIGKIGMQTGRIVDCLDDRFECLDETFFSLGQDENYYANIAHLGEVLRKEILCSLRDIAYDSNRFEKVKNESVAKTSLLRGVSSFAVKNQLNRIAHGGAKLTKYKFSYNISDDENDNDSQIEFNVNPKSNPPTNIHVLIGRNGTGKTTLIKNIIRGIQHIGTDDKFKYGTNERVFSHTKFANVLCVAFSPFDDFSELNSENTEIPYSYIGFNKKTIDLFKEIEDQFFISFKNCMMNPKKKKLWRNAINTLRSDPTFNEISVDLLSTDILSDEKDQIDSNKSEIIRSIFSTLSSGHKVVLLIITCCVDKIIEKSVIFIDEPENHLHPPLLSALIRALSDLLNDRNGVAIISTHSPVVLQEVPQSCIWALRRSKEKLIAERLEMQTFGASIGALTNEIFKLEVTNSGFHKLISEAVVKSAGCDDYDSLSSEFDDQLGNEAAMLLRTLLALHNSEED